MEKEKLKKLSRNLTNNEDSYMKSFRKNLDMYLSQSDITIRSLSEDADIPQNTLNSILYNNTSDCHLSTAISLAKALNVSLDELIGANTINNITLESLQICRNLPDNILYLIRWFIRHQEKIYNDVANKERYINVMSPEYMGNGNLKVVYDFTQVNISNISDDIKHKVFLGIQLPCGNYMPTYSPYDILLIANDRNPKQNENCIVICRGNMYIGKRVVVGNSAKYYSIRDGKFRVNENEIDELVGYVAGVKQDLDTFLQRI
jgi:hypothetical protein